MRVFQHNTFTLTIHFRCWAKIRSNYFKPYYYSVTMFNLHYSQVTLLIHFTWKLSYHIVIPYFTLQNTYIARFLIKYCNLVPRKYWPRQLKMTLDWENHIIKKLKKHNARIFTTVNQFFFPFEAILPRENFTQNTDAISSLYFPIY